MPIVAHDPALERIISTSQPINELAGGFGGEQGPAEGPVWWQEGDFLLFSDIHNNRRMKWAEGEGVSVFTEPTNRANGLTRDPQGRLVACEHDGRRVSRVEPDGSITVVANGFQGRPLNRPNDVVVKSDGAIYFTDPNAGMPVQTQSDLNFPGVYRVSPDLGTITLLVRDYIGPNGLAFSPDESVLYIIDSRVGPPAGLRHATQWDPGLGHQPRLQPQPRRTPRNPRRHEAGHRRQRVRRRLRRHLDHRPVRQASRQHRYGSAPAHQHGLRRGRLEDPLFHQLGQAVVGARQHPRDPGAKPRTLSNKEEGSRPISS